MERGLVMLLQVKRIPTRDTRVANSTTKSVPIRITQKDVDELNRRIKKDIMENEARREKGLEVAARCRMR